MIKNRKNSHLILALSKESQAEVNCWDEVKVDYQALPEKDFRKIDTSISFLGKKLSLPLIIGPLTFPYDKKSWSINERLVKLAEEKGLAFNIGSQRIMIEKNLDKEAKKLRRLAPKACLLANFGAVQLNYGWGVKEARRCIEALEADGLMLHLNVLQEIIQPEGNENFAGLLKKIEKLMREVQVPVLVKEVGFGIDIGTAKKLYEVGAYGVDVAGKGGTNWAKIEASRRGDDWAEPFKEIGWPACELVEAISKIKPKKRILIASGGIRSGLHIFKALSLGADLTSMAQPFLLAASQGYPHLLELYNRLTWQYKVSLMVLRKREK